MSSNGLLLLILLPLGGGILALCIPQKVRILKEFLTFAISGLVCFLSFWNLLKPMPDFSVHLIEMGRFSLHFELATDPLSAGILIFTSGICVLVTLYSFAHMKDNEHTKAFYAFVLLALGGSSGVLLADHLLLLLIFWEIVSASLYFLINTGRSEARAGATKTFVTLGGVDGCLLLGIGIVWLVSDSFIVSDITLAVDGWLPGAAFVLMTIAAITKAGSMPFSSWLPAAGKHAPAPVMALLPAAIDKLLGIFLLIVVCTRLFILGPGFGNMLMIIGSVTILAAVMVAVVQHDLRQLLSYHAVSQVGYMILGIGTLTPIGIAGGIFHLINNSIYKSCLFLCEGSIEKKTKTSDIGQLGGLAKVMPFTFIACLIGSLAISGVPPFNGFVSKWMVYQGVLDTGTRYSLVFLAVAMFGSALTLASFIKVIYSVFLGKKTERTAKVGTEARPVAVFSVLSLSILCILFGVFYRLPLDQIIIPGIGTGVSIAGLWNSTLATGLILVGIVFGLIVFGLTRFRKSVRTVSAFTGGEVLDEHEGHINATHFYDTIKTLPLLKPVFAAQARGNLDPYAWLGGIGLSFTKVLRRIHNGLLPWYLSWILFGVTGLIVIFRYLL